MPPGLLLEGDFGTGKSHWLERLNHLALEQNFICSTIVLNKETPLHDLKKIYRAAIEAARAPGKTGPALTEIAHTYRADTAPGYRSFFEWVHGNQHLDSRYAATLHVFERSVDEEIQQKIIAEWTGYPMYARDLKAALKELGETSYKITRAGQEPLLQRFEFMTRFFRSAGYAGWVILLDEAEMISKYSIRQRGKSYAHEILWGCLLFLNARGEPQEFVYNRLELLSDVLWRPADRLPAARRRLAATLFGAATLSPAFLLTHAAHTPPDLFGSGGQVVLEIPVGRVASKEETVRPGPSEIATEMETFDIAGEMCAAQIYWTPAPPAIPLLPLLAERGLILEPFHRCAAGLREVYGEMLAEN